MVWSLMVTVALADVIPILRTTGLVHHWGRRSVVLTLIERELDHPGSHGGERRLCVRLASKH